MTFIEELRAAAVCIHIGADKEVAEPISRLLARAATELESYTAPEAALIKDAERYRFLKARRGNIVEIAWNSFYSDIYSTAKMGNVDAAIDAAMRLQCGPQPERP